MRMPDTRQDLASCRKTLVHLYTMYSVVYFAYVPSFCPSALSLFRVCFRCCTSLISTKSNVPRAESAVDHPKQRLTTIQLGIVFDLTCFEGNLSQSALHSHIDQATIVLSDFGGVSAIQGEPPHCVSHLGTSGMMAATATR